MKLEHCNRASCVQIIEALQARLWNYEHGTAMMCADAAIGAAKQWEKEVESLQAQVQTLADRLQLNDMENAALKARLNAYNWEAENAGLKANVALLRDATDRMVNEYQSDASNYARHGAVAQAIKALEATK